MKPPARSRRATAAPWRRSACSPSISITSNRSTTGMGTQSATRSCKCSQKWRGRRSVRATWSAAWAARNSSLSSRARWRKLPSPRNACARRLPRQAWSATASGWPRRSASGCHPARPRRRLIRSLPALMTPSTVRNRVETAAEEAAGAPDARPQDGKNATQGRNRRKEEGAVNNDAPESCIAEAMLGRIFTLPKSV